MCFVDRFARRAERNGVEFTEKLIEKVREYVFLYNTGHPEYKNVVKKGEAWRDISEELDQTSKSVFF